MQTDALQCVQGRLPACCATLTHLYVLLLLLVLLHAWLAPDDDGASTCKPRSGAAGAACTAESKQCFLKNASLALVEALTLLSCTAALSDCGNLNM